MPGFPSVLCVAGNDFFMGAGLQMDALVCDYFKIPFFGISTLDTVQSPLGLHDVQMASVEDVRKEMSDLLDSGQVASIKVGALGTASMVSVVAEVLSAYRHIPLVVDPVFQASAVGDKRVFLLTPEGQDIAIDQLFPLASVITPNHMEFEELSFPETGAAILLTDGHGTGAVINDRLMLSGEEVACYSHERVAGFTETHGTGCALSTAISCKLAYGHSVVQSCSVTNEIEEIIRAIEGS